MSKSILKDKIYYKFVIILGMILSTLWVIFVDTKPFSDFEYYYNLSVDIANGLPWGDTYTSVGYLELGFKRLVNTYFLGDDVGYSTYGSKLNNSSNIFIFIITNNIRNIIFIPAIVYILIYSKLILEWACKGKTYLLDKYTLYNVILFYMFTGVYFITEGQGRYAFPEIFIMVYCFYYCVENRFKYNC